MYGRDRDPPPRRRDDSRDRYDRRDRRRDSRSPPRGRRERYGGGGGGRGRDPRRGFRPERERSMSPGPWEPQPRMRKTLFDVLPEGGASTRARARDPWATKREGRENED